MSSSRLEKLKYLWPDRDIFQGSARTYIRFSEKHNLPWNNLEKWLWVYTFRGFNSQTKFLDFGAGAGKLTRIAAMTTINPKNIVALEPNPILRGHIRDKFPFASTLETATNLSSQLKDHGGKRHLIAANMVFNHIDHESLVPTLVELYGALNPSGYLAMVIPHPEHKAWKFGRENRDTWAEEEEAPWGGYTEYHHRSLDMYQKILEGLGFQSLGSIEWGYPDTMYGHEIDPYEEKPGSLRDPRRLLIIARKRGEIDPLLLEPYSIRPTSISYKNGQVVYGSCTK